MKLASPQKGYTIQFQAVRDFLNHLQNYHIINDRIQKCGETLKEYYFVLLFLRDMHQQLCKVDNLKQLFKDVNLNYISLSKPISLRMSGTQELIRFYKVILLPKKGILWNLNKHKRRGLLIRIEQSDFSLCIPKIIDCNYNPKDNDQEFKVSMQFIR